MRHELTGLNFIIRRSIGGSLSRFVRFNIEDGFRLGVAHGHLPVMLLYTKVRGDLQRG